MLGCIFLYFLVCSVSSHLPVHACTCIHGFHQGICASKFSSLLATLFSALFLDG